MAHSLSLLQTALAPSDEGVIALHFTPGRLGNQLYELATAIALALSQNKKLYFPDLKNNARSLEAFDIVKLPSTLVTKQKTSQISAIH